MRAVLATLFVAFLIAVLAAPAASAASTEVNVRIEGKSETLFEGPILAEPHGVRATSDPISPKIRRCDSINPLNPANVVPAPTPTAVSADAMTLIGESFDGRWYYDFEDYFLTRWGPESQSTATASYWGILVNDVFTPVGGCQFALDGGDEVLWIYDAFKNRPTLALFPEAAGYGSGPRPLIVKDVAPNEPVPLEVVSYADDQKNKPPAAPGRLGSSGYKGAKVAEVLTGPKGFQKVGTTALATTLDSTGKTSVQFSAPGWHRIKATVGNPGAESAIRSNRLDICVEGDPGPALEGASTCDELPAADLARIPPPTVGEIEGPRPKPTPEDKPGGGGGSDPPPSVSTAAIQLTLPRLNRKKIARGRLGVSWRITDPGAGVKGWTISSQTVGKRGARFVTRATGTSATSATVRLPRGHSYRLRFTITDALDRSSSVGLGKVTVPGARRR